MASRALPDLIARIRVDSSSVDSAMTNLVSSFGRASLALAGVAVGIGALILGGKSIIDIAEKHDAAQRSLAQAVDANNAALGKQVPIVVDVTKQQDALTIAHNAAIKAEIALTDARVKHGKHSQQAYLAELSYTDALIHDKNAREALTAAEAAGEPVMEQMHIDLSELQSQVDDFIKTNRRYISDQSEVIDGYAKLTRSGLSQTEVQRAMNDAVDLAAIKHISLSEAVGLLDNAEHGRMRGLIDLGITTGKFTDAQGNLILANHSVAQAMTEVDAKLKDGRKSLTDLQQDTNTLSNDWQDLANRGGGKVLLTLLDAIVVGASKVYDQFARWGSDDKMWATINNRLVDMANWINKYIVVPLGGAASAANRVPLSAQTNADIAAEHLGLPPGTYLPPGSGAPYGFDPRNGYAWAQSQGVPGQMGRGMESSPITSRQAGGSILPNRIYTVGEAGPETLVMGASGGTVIPNRGGGSNPTINFHQVMADPWAISNELAWLKKTRRL